MWAAGFFEGEGNSHYNTTSKQLKLSITQVDRRPLERMKALFGGGIHFRAGDGKNQRDRWVWYLSRFEDVQAAVAAMWFGLIQKKDQYIIQIEKMRMIS